MDTCDWKGGCDEIVVMIDPFEYPEGRTHCIECNEILCPLHLMTVGNAYGRRKTDMCLACVKSWWLKADDETRHDYQDLKKAAINCDGCKCVVSDSNFLEVEAAKSALGLRYCFDCVLPRWCYLGEDARKMHQFTSASPNRRS